MICDMNSLHMNGVSDDASGVQRYRRGLKNLVEILMRSTIISNVKDVLKKTFTQWEGYSRKDGTVISSSGFPFDDFRT